MLILLKDAPKEELSSLTTPKLTVKADEHLLRFSLR